MRDYRESTIKKAINNMVFTTGIELLEFIIFDVLLVGNYHVGRNDLGRLVDPNLLFSGTFDIRIRIVCHQQGNVVITVDRDNNGFFRITDVTVEEPSRRPLYSFPLDSPEPIQLAINDDKLLIWSANNDAYIEMKISDIFITGKHWDSGHHFIPIIKINKNEVLDYFLDFMGVKLDQASYHLIKHDIGDIIDMGEPIRMSIRDKRDCVRIANPLTVSKQMILVNDGPNNMIAYNLSEETFQKYNNSSMNLKFIAMSICHDDDDDDSTLFTCAMGTQNKGAEGYYYVDDIEWELTEHKLPRFERDIVMSEHEMSEIMRELSSK